MSPDGETEVVLEKPRRAPRKRAPKVVSEESTQSTPITRVPRRTAPRKRAPKKVVEEIKEEKDEAPKRKAPTPIASEKKKRSGNRRQLIVISVMIFVGIAASAAVGFTDKGQIDVEGTIAWRNEQERSAGRESAVIPVQNTPQVADGGLIGRGIGGPEEGTASTSQAVASSTPQTASSTEPVGQAPLTNAEAEAVAAQAAAENPAQ